MPLQKPRGRKRPSHKKAYASVALLVVIGLSSVIYAYLNGYLPGLGPGASTTTTGANCPAPPTNATGVIFACVNTSKGSFEVELFNASVPKTVTNFVNLAKSGFYNNLVWHRIVPGFVIQTGDPNTKNAGGNRATWGQGTSGTTIPFENDTSLHNYEGYLGMASTGAGLGGSSQFYINLSNSTSNSSLDGKYAVFGKVLGNGMSVVNAIAAVQTYADSSSQYYEQPVTPSQAMVLSITIMN